MPIAMPSNFRSLLTTKVKLPAPTMSAIAAGIRLWFNRKLTALSIQMLVRSPEEVFADAALFEKTLALGAGWRDQPLFGPSRSDLLSILAA